ncbi:hypothetical protein [uncultured Clostridium sp.]|jgi:hypothetical protein|uniref:hypothetical protein n=1 Tax=uncultured Clostridium sp. TaxID=59620 RepID=UPI002638F2AC|nr:hypothetical protein [uncultured Clostridium sp.]
MKKKTLILSLVVLAFAIFVVIYSKHIHNNNPMVIKQDKPYHELHFVSSGKLAYEISLGDTKGNSDGLHTNVILSNTTKKGTYIVVCPKNSFTNQLVKDKLEYSGMITFRKLGLTDAQLKQLGGR